MGEGVTATILSCLDEAERCLAAAISGSHFNAFLRLNPRLLEEAEALDKLASQGRRLPLHGMVFAVKDNIETQNLETTGGAVALSGYLPRQDANVVRRMKSAGALIIGKTNLDELAGAGSTISSLGGQSLNPYDALRTPAGSSGGSAIAVAIGACCVALGTETVNSIRNPAHVCGVFGLRPTRGLVGRSGILPVSPSMDVVGPLARSVHELSRVFSVLIGHDPFDSITEAAARYDLDGLSPERWPSVKDIRIGVPRGLFGMGEEHRAMNDVISLALDRLSAAGCVISELDDPLFQSARLYDDMALHAYEFRQAFDAWLTGLGADAPIASFKAYVEDGRWPQRTMKVLLNEALHAETADGKMAYQRKLQATSDIRRRVTHLMKIHRLNALAYPAQHRPALLVGEPSRPERNGALASGLGWPAINLPIGSVAGLPVGLDLMSKPYGEPLLFALAEAAQQRDNTIAPPVER